MNTSYTIKDIYALPEGVRAELLDGKIYYMAPPNRHHQKLVLSLSRIIADYIESHAGSCEVYVAPFAVFLNHSAKDNKTYVEPDISVICEQNKLTDRGCEGAPDWVIEIVSPGSRKMDYGMKLFEYHSAGVREYWIVDPDKGRIVVWNFENDDMEEFLFSDTVKSHIYEDLTIDFAKLYIE